MFQSQKEISPKIVKCACTINRHVRVHKSFEEKRYWRGPVWVNCNWIIYQGLKNKDKKFAEIIRKKTINLIEKKKFREYYSCKSGLGMGAKNFSWTAALYLDFKLNTY